LNIECVREFPQSAATNEGAKRVSIGQWTDIQTMVTSLEAFRLINNRPQGTLQQRKTFYENKKQAKKLHGPRHGAVKLSPGEWKEPEITPIVPNSL